MPPRSRVLVPYLSLSSFVQTDIDILREQFDVELVDCRSAAGVARTVRALRDFDLVFCWFGSIWFLPIVAAARAVDVPVIIVCGGYDVANLPEIGYGNMARPLSRALGRLVFRLATAVTSFSESAYAEAVTNAKVDPRKLQTIPLGVDPAAGASSVDVAKSGFVLTIGNIDESTIHRKGLIAIARTSRLLPGTEFVMAGRSHPSALRQLQSIAGSNMTFPGFLPTEEVNRLMASAKVYLQPSLHEGFGLAVAEAMLHGAIPVVSNRFSLPEVVGDSGFYADPDDPGDMAAKVMLALGTGSAAGHACRRRVVENFDVARRRSALLQLSRCSSYFTT
jgi:glycosyltransferase involved in cell wall biosynthesis